MLAILIISFLALMGAAFTLYFWLRTPPDSREKGYLQPRQFGGLFEDRGSNGTLVEGEEQTGISALRVALLERARSGELDTLSEAHAADDAALYHDVLDALVESVPNRQEDFLALVSHISKSDDLRGNRPLAERLIEAWKAAPGRSSTIEMMHIAALSDDAATYERAVETVLEFWRRGKLAEFRAEELSELFVSQFWVIAPEARRGGGGFALKRRLLGVRRELAAATPAR